MSRALQHLSVVVFMGVFGLAQAPSADSFVQYSSSRQTKFVEVPDVLAANAARADAPQDLSFSRATGSSSKPEKFRWGRAIAESANFMAIQQGVMLASDKWSRYELTHGKWFKTYMRAISGNDRWDDGDPTRDNYLGHPIQGAVTGFIQIQNDPAGRRLEFRNTRPYWISRLKAMAWNAAYSAQFEIGPFGEASIQKLGSYTYRNCPRCPVTNGAGMVDFVITPTLGTVWLVGEDLLDKYIPAKLERKFGRNAWTNLIRCVVNPSRSAANILDRKRPWYRPSRDDVR